MSSNPKVVPAPIGVADARAVLEMLRAVPGHVFVPDDVSLTDPDVPPIRGHRRITGVHLVVLARRRRMRLVTFDAGIATLAGDETVELLTS